MGEVYRAWDPRIGREVAIKVLSAGTTDRDRVARFEQEARAAGALNHPNIVVVFDVGVHEGLPYVVTELLEGETLRHHLKQAPLSPRKGLAYAVQVARGLAAAHAKGIVHRDLKPENLLVTNDGRVKILDFGLAKLAPEKSPPGSSEAPTVPVTEPGTVLGTVGYMAPEQVRGRASDHRADVFALGSVLYEMLSGRRAFPGESPADVMSAILREDPPPLSESGRHLPPALSHLVQRCLEKSPEERFQSARDLAFGLQEMERQWGASEVLPPGAGRRSRQWARGLVVLALAALVGTAAYAVRTAWQRPVPSFRQVTFRRGTVLSARFAPDTGSILYAAAWEGMPVEVFLARPGSPESRPLGYTGARLAAVSRTGEMALCLDHRYVGGERFRGTLARVSLAGGAVREVLEDVEDADWSPDGGELAVVRSSGAGGHSRLEYPVGTTLYETAGAIRDVRVSPDGARIAFLDDPVGLRSSGAVAVIDRSGHKRTLTRAFDSARGVAWSARGGELWFTAADDVAARALQAVSLAGRTRIVAPLPGSLTLFDIAPDGRLLLAQEEERHGIVGLAPGATGETELSWFDDSGVGDLSADGRLLLFGDRNGVYLRRTDGSPAVHLGEGYADSLSPDHHWALTTTSDENLMMLPTGPGVAKKLPRHSITSYAGALWLPDGKRIVFNAREPGRELRAYVQDLEQGQPRPVTPEGVWAHSISRDGALVAAVGAGRPISLHPVDGGEGRLVPGSEPGDLPAGWTSDGRALWVFRRGQVPAPVFRLDLETGRRHLAKRLIPADSAGVVSITAFRTTADGSSHAYSYRRVRSTLYLVEGLR